MKTNYKLLLPGIFLMLLPRIYYHLVSKEGGIISLVAVLSIAVGAILILYSFGRKENYKFNDIKNDKIFYIKSLYITPWVTRVGINFKEGEKQYFMSPIPGELKGVKSGEKYFKKKDKIVKMH